MLKMHCTLAKIRGVFYCAKTQRQNYGVLYERTGFGRDNEAECRLWPARNYSVDATHVNAIWHKDEDRAPEGTLPLKTQ
jgi:hypothetical protein